MGLDIVELVVAIEVEFKISIPNAVAAKLAYVGDYQAYVVQALGDRGEVVDPAGVWLRIKRVVIEQCAVDPDLVVPGAHLIYDLGLD